MLTVYSAQGSPGASTTAMHLAAHWASEGREVLLIEADPAGGSLSHNLGIQFTPGSASFVASGLPVQSNHLIDHAQDVLFESLHVMPAPASPTGARGIFHTFADFSEELRTISENEMAVIIDGGRVTADTAASGLTTGAAGVVVVCRNNSDLSSLEPLRDVISAVPGGDGPAGCAMSIGKSPMTPEEWEESCGLTFCGSIEAVSDMASDLSAYMVRGKRKSKKWRTGLERVSESLYAYAHPPVSNRPRARPPEPEPAQGAEPADGAGRETPNPAGPDPSAQDPAGYGQAPPMAPPEAFPAYGQPAPMAPAAGTGYGPSHYLPPASEQPPAHGQPHYLPPAGHPGDPQGYGEAPPMAPPEAFPAYGQPAPPFYPPAQYPAQPPYEQAPAAYQQPPGAYEQAPPGAHEAYPPAQYPTQPYEQPPAAYQQPPGAHEAYPPTQYPTQPEPPTQQTHEQPPAQPEPPTQQAYEQPPAEPEPPTQPYEEASPVSEEHPGPGAPQPADSETEAAPRPNIQPTGSFRDWAVKLHGSNAQDMTAHRGG